MTCNSQIVTWNDRLKTNNDDEKIEILVNRVNVTSPFCFMRDNLLLKILRDVVNKYLHSSRSHLAYGL